MVLFFICLFISLTSISYSHGIIYRELKGGIGIEIKYDDGSPLAFGKVKIYSPKDKKNVFQEGLTDKNGRFIFFPDKKGKWRIEVSDNMGHGIVKDIQVEEEKKETQGEEKKGIQVEEKMNIKEGKPHFLLWQKILIGVSLIWGITGTLLYILAKMQIERCKMKEKE